MQKTTLRSETPKVSNSPSPELQQELSTSSSNHVKPKSTSQNEPVQYAIMCHRKRRPLIQIQVRIKNQK